MTGLVDTHCHIQSIGQDKGERITRERWTKSGYRTGDEAVRDAVNNGVGTMICVGCDAQDSQLAVDFVNNKPHLWASVGIHPHEAGHYAKRPLPKEFTDLVSNKQVVAVGECGLDYYYTHSSKADQLKVLRMQIELAIQSNLPLIFHVREAYDDFWPIFDDYKNLKGVLHSFTDSKENLSKALDRGLYIGVNGIVTFAKDSEQQEMYKAIPLDHLLLETDAPFLTPHPHRGKINEPKYVVDIMKFLTELRDERPEDLASKTTANACKLFIRIAHPE